MAPAVAPGAAVRTAARAALCLVAWSLCAATARAAPAADPCLGDDACHAHYQRALARSRAGEHAEALPAFLLAYQLRQVPWLLINIGRTLHRLGRAPEAMEYFERYLQAEPNGPPERRRKVEAFLAEARALSQPLQTLHPAPSTAAAEPAAAAAGKAPPGQPEAPAAAAPGTGNEPGAPDGPEEPPPAPVAAASAPAAVAPATAVTAPSAAARTSSTQELLAAAQLLASKARRPRWRIATGLSVLAAGTVVTAFGISALSVDGTCQASTSAQWQTPMCLATYQTAALGGGLLGAGLALDLVGALLIAWPPRLPKVELISRAPLRPSGLLLTAGSLLGGM